MNRGYFNLSLKESIKRFFLPDVIMDYLVSLRYVEYVYKTGGVLYYLLFFYHIRRYNRLGQKLGFTIPPNTIGYGVKIPHWGTIVIGPQTRIGNFAVLNTSICITNHGSLIGDSFYCSTGAKIISKVELGDNVTLAANSVLTKVDAHRNNNVMMAGIPAKFVRNDMAWYIRDGAEYERRANKVKSLMNHE